MADRNIEQNAQFVLALSLYDITVQAGARLGRAIAACRAHGQEPPAGADSLLANLVVPVRQMIDAAQPTTLVEIPAELGLDHPAALPVVFEEWNAKLPTVLIHDYDTAPSFGALGETRDERIARLMGELRGGDALNGWIAGSVSTTPTAAEIEQACAKRGIPLVGGIAGGAGAGAPIWTPGEQAARQAQAAGTAAVEATAAKLGYGVKVGWGAKLASSGLGLLSMVGTAVLFTIIPELLHGGGGAQQSAFQQHMQMVADANSAADDAESRFPDLYAGIRPPPTSGLMLFAYGLMGTLTIGVMTHQIGLW